MMRINYIRSNADASLFGRKVKDHTAFVIVYADGAGGIFSTPENINEIIRALRKDFKVKNLGKLVHFLDVT
jgi:hypothetical protein